MVIGVDRPLAAQWFTGSQSSQVADHLIDVHVRLGAASGLPHTQRELIIALAFRYGRSGGHDGVTLALTDHAEPGIHACCSLFDAGERMNELRGQAVVSDVEVAQR